MFGVFQFGWYYKTEEHQTRLKHEVKGGVPPDSSIEGAVSGNSPIEEPRVRKLGFLVVYCHQNASRKQDNYRITLSDNEFDMIYVVRITPFKRHELVVELDSLLLVGDYS